MCSNCDCDKDTLGTNIQSPLQELPKPCRRCGDNPFIILDKVHVECKKCFLESCNKRIRSTIGKSKLLKNNDPILIAYSGGASSTALLDLIRNSIEYEARREQKFRPSILHIDEQLSTSFDSYTESDLTKRRNKLKSLLRRLSLLYPNWPIYWTSLEVGATKFEQQCDNECLYFKYDPQRDDHNSQFDLILDKKETRQKIAIEIKNLDLTDKQCYIQAHTNSLTNRVADKINSQVNPNDRFKYIFTGNSATQLANDLLVNVILGQGATTYSRVSVCDKRPQVPIFRPMRDFSKKEVAFYVKARGLEYEVSVNLVTFADSKSSIQTATEAFLSKLYIDYPSTYSTLLKTGDKLQD